MGIPDTGDTAWMLASSALVLLMTPGLAFFYGGMVRAKGVLNMLMMSISAMGVVTVLWVLYGYSLSFGNDKFDFIGDPSQYWGLKGLIGGNAKAAVAADPSTGTAAVDAVNLPLAGTIPQLVFVMFYFPVAHWVFAFDGFTGEHGGWIANKLKAIDFAGGTAVHINSGAAGLALAIVLGKRKGWPGTPMRPHNLPFVMLGAGLLWFGWYGFNAGSALSSGGVAASTFVTTTVATATAMLAWLLVEKIRDGHPTSLGAASGIVAGLVAITPSCSSVNVLGALVVGFLGGAICALAVGLKFKFGFDDALDVVGVHMVGGLTGTLLIGFLAAPEAPAAVKGLFYGGGFDQLWRQAVGAFAVLAYSFIVTTILALILKFTIGLRLGEEDEAGGIDEAEHAETGYDFVPVGGTSVLARHGAEE
jgi:Amt family ammonium transporter